MTQETNIQAKPQRSSNLELYRIICMLMIVAHHYVINSGLAAPDGVMMQNLHSANSLYYWLFGVWGKTGINCFMLITGYFMCKSQITLRKFLKLMLEVYLYKLVICAIFMIAGYEHLTGTRILQLVLPFWGFNQNFTSCFIGFWLTIPFWNILVRNMTQRQHLLLTGLLLLYYSVMAMLPPFEISFNYMTWFGVLYLVASYIRLYPHPIFENRRFWGCATFLTVGMAMLSVVVPELLFGKGMLFMVSDANKPLALAVAVVSFLWMKNLPVPQSKWINRIGGSTFGVLLIHANSDAMRQWLWHDTIDCVRHYDMPLAQTVAYSVGSVAVIFTVCILIDRLRIRLLEEPVFKWMDSKENERDK